jgi:hypothetical protein
LAATTPFANFTWSQLLFDFLKLFIELPDRNNNDFFTKCLLRALNTQQVKPRLPRHRRWPFVRHGG